MKFALVVEDADVISKVARKILEGMNMIVVDAGTGADGLAHCARAMPDLVLIDSDLPDMTGIAFVETLRQSDVDVLPRFLYCTTDAEPHKIADAYRAGIAGYILKPYERATLEPKVRELADGASRMAV